MLYSVDVTLLQQARLEKGLTQKELAKLANLSLIVINKAEMGKATPRPKSIKRICDVLELKIGDVCRVQPRQDHKATKTA